MAILCLPFESNGSQLLVKYDSEKKQYSPYYGTPKVGTKGFSKAAQLHNVTVKMETPVIYFYGGKEGERVNVKVGFNGGTISQWFPNRTTGDTPNLVIPTEKELLGLQGYISEEEDYTFVEAKEIDFQKGYEGGIEWDVELMKADDALTFKHIQTPAWIYPKVSGANMVKVGEEYEDYLFYRGVGNLNLPITLSVNEAEEVIIQNKSEEAIPFTFAYEKVGEVVRYKTVGAVKDTSIVAESDWVVAEANWQPAIFSEMRKGLMSLGLTKEEANGMVKTWWRSYFEQDGLRVFWVVPEKELEKLLPLSVSPVPEDIVRVIVGRGDLLRPSFEKEMITCLGKKRFSKFQRDRFTEVYMNRLRAMISEPVFQCVSEEEFDNSYFRLERHIGETKKSSSLYLKKGKPAKDNEIGEMGEWEVIDENEFHIGDLIFKRDESSGVFKSQLDQGETGLTKYEIQLKRCLN